jgi:hypothetical protein
LLHNDVVEDVWSSGKSGEWQIDYRGSRLQSTLVYDLPEV